MPDLPPIYVDESLSQVYLPQALRNEGLVAYKVTDQFSRGIKDPDWLPVAGRNGWIVLTKDKAIQKRPNEMLALVNSGVRAFVLAAGAMTGPDQAALFVRLIPKMTSYVGQLPAPFLVRVGKEEAVRCFTRRPDTQVDNKPMDNRLQERISPDEIIGRIS